LEKACIERCKPFCFLGFEKRATDSSTIRTGVLGVRISPPLPYLEKAHIERYEPFCFLGFEKRATDSSTISTRVLGVRISPFLPYSKPQQKCWGFLVYRVIEIKKRLVSKGMSLFSIWDLRK
ncbi:hypothetical protein, partial [Aliivibrio fischeri]|uniref:hypothetical protein n=1 Tax=Aliivibrio fischeri TaxID=668 RepID=UPI001BE42E2A